MPKVQQDKIFREFRQLQQGNIAVEILQRWDQEDIFRRSISSREGKPAYVFYEGPPSANGMPGIHHVLARSIKDLFCRYKTLQGYQVHRKGGWDTHGLPVELGVEKMLGITKKDIGEKISVAEYNARCREEVMRYKDVWDDITRKMGYWVDLDDPYITFENNYIETIWWLLRQFYDKGLLYKGLKIQPYSPAAGTGLSSHELNLPGCYREVKDTSCVAQFKLFKDDKSKFLFDTEDEDVRLLAWTTTPWTLPSNTALAVGKEIKYVKVRTYNKYTYLPVSVILAEDLLRKFFLDIYEFEDDYEKYREDLKDNNLLDAYIAIKEWIVSSKLGVSDKQFKLATNLQTIHNLLEKGISIKPFQGIDLYKVIKKFCGKDLDGLRYEQLLPYVQPDSGDAFRVVIGDFVSTEDGTGIVHIAPSFGADDMRMAQQYGPAVSPSGQAGEICGGGYRLCRGASEGSLPQRRRKRSCPTETGPRKIPIGR